MALSKDNYCSSWKLSWTSSVWVKWVHYCFHMYKVPRSNRQEVPCKNKVKKPPKDVNMVETLVLSVIKVQRNILNTVLNFFHVTLHMGSFGIITHVSLSDEVLMQNEIEYHCHWCTLNVNSTSQYSYHWLLKIYQFLQLRSP